MMILRILSCTNAGYPFLLNTPGQEKKDQAMNFIRRIVIGLLVQIWPRQSMSLLMPWKVLLRIGKTCCWITERIEMA
jgi:hypothetical protein